MRYLFMVMLALVLVVPHTHNVYSKTLSKKELRLQKAKKKRLQAIAARANKKKKSLYTRKPTTKKQSRSSRTKNNRLKPVNFKKLHGRNPTPWTRFVKRDKRNKPVRLKQMNSYAFRLLPLKERHKYLKSLRRAYISMISEFQKNEKRFRKSKRRKGAKLSPSEQKLFNLYQELLAFSSLMQPANAEEYAWRQAGKRCFYAGYASVYVEQGGGVTCRRPTADGSSDYINSWNGTQYCANGQILCNPLIFGLGNNGNGTQTVEGKRKGYCVSPGRNAFDNCQQLYYNDSGYPASAISDFLLDQSTNPGAIRQFIELQSHLEEFCEGINGTSGNRFATAKRNCSQFNKRTAKLIEKARASGGDLTVAAGDEERRETAGDGLLEDGELPPGDNLVTADVVSEPGAERAKEEFPAADSCQDSIIRQIVDDPSAIRQGVGGDFACAACMYEHVQRANGGRMANERVSPSMMMLLSIVAKNCPGSDGSTARGPDPAKVMNLISRFGACPAEMLPRPEEGRYDRINGRYMDRTTELLNMTTRPNEIFSQEAPGWRDRTKETYNNAFYREYGILPQDMKNIFCPGGTLRENPGDVSEAIRNLSGEMERNRRLVGGDYISEYVPTRRLMRDRRGKLAQCMAYAQSEKDNGENSCKVVESSAMEIDQIAAQGLKDQNKNLPTFVSSPIQGDAFSPGEGNCFTLLKQTQEEGGTTTMYGLNQFGEPILANIVNGGDGDTTTANNRCGNLRVNDCVAIQPPASEAFCRLPENITSKVVVDGTSGIEVNCQDVMASQSRCTEAEDSPMCSTRRALLPGTSLTYHRLSCEGPKFELAPATRLRTTPAKDRPDET